MRRRMVRWMSLGTVLCFRDVSQAVRDRFPTLSHIKLAGFMTESELIIYENIETVHLKYWIPFEWIANLAAEEKVLNEFSFVQKVKRPLNRHVRLT